MQLGETRGGKELGYRDRHRYVWCACLDCGKERWVKSRKGEPAHKRCYSCGKVATGRASRGNGHHLWKGGLSRTSQGYVLVKLYPDDFFFSMAQKKKYVLEHRLVMAKHLGRNLHLWEIVHHKNHVKTDNRIGNLELISDDRHKQLTIMEGKLDTLLATQVELLKQIRLLRFENKQLKGEYLEATS